MKKLIPLSIISLFAVSCLDVSVVDNIYLEFSDTKEMTDVKAKGDTIQFYVKWSGLQWVVYEDVPEGRDTLIKAGLPIAGGRYDGYGNTAVAFVVPENKSSEDREATLVLQSLRIDEEGTPSHKLTTKITQLGKR